MTTSSDAGPNRLGALALRISDRLEAAARQAGRCSVSSATALSALDRFLDAPSIDELSRVLGLTSSATVRLVDGLVADGLVSRVPGPDARMSVVRLTSSGRRRAKRIVAARAEVLIDALSPLSASERAAFQVLADKVLVGLVMGAGTRGWMCRLCDTEACGAPRGEPCPITRAALA